MYSVLIVDDEPKVSLLIKALIEWDALGLELMGIAHDGISALEMISTYKPNIVITDIRMPGYDGIELISRVKENEPKIDFIIVSGYRHFDYAQKAIRFGVEDYLLKPLKALEINDTLRKMLSKYRQTDAEFPTKEMGRVGLGKDRKKLHDHFVLNLLQNNDGLASEEMAEEDLITSLEELNSAYHINFKPDLFQGMIVKADLDVDTLSSNILKLLMDKCSGVIDKNLRPLCHDIVIYPTRQGMYVVINYDGLKKRHMRKALMTIIDELQAMGELFSKIKVTIGLGTATSDVSALKQSLRDAEGAVANRLLFGGGKIIEKMDLDASQVEFDTVFSLELRKRLIRAVDILDHHEIKAVCERFLTGLQQTKGLNGRLIQKSMEELSELFIFALKNQQMLDQHILESQEHFLEDMMMCHRQSDVYARLMTFMTDAIEHIQEVRKKESNKPIRDIQKYIQLHYSESLNLEGVSQIANFNPTYFSLLFKKETGMNFLEYVTEVRINEAKRILADSSKSILDVAIEVGYSDVKHFSKVFTKLAGIHPSKYRKLYY